jgi:HEAT repeat protein
MEKWDARPLQSEYPTEEDGWNVFKLESRKNLHSKIHEFIDLTTNSNLSTSEIQQRLQLCRQQYGKPFAILLVHYLKRTDVAEREAIVWLLTQLQDQDTIPLLQRLSQHKQQPRSVRLSAALALAGMGQTPEMITAARPFLYAIS